MVPIRRIEPNAINTSGRNAKRWQLYYCPYGTSDWFKNQSLWNLRKAACKFIPCFPTNFLITKSCLSPSYTENPTWGMWKIVNVFWLLTLMIGRNLLTQKHTFQKSNLKTFYSINCLFVGLCILCVKMKTFLCEESVLHHNKINCFPSYPDHYLIPRIQLLRQILFKIVPRFWLA